MTCRLFRPRRPFLVLLLVVPLLALLLAACGDQTVTLTVATILPTSGPDAPLGQAMQQAVDLAVSQNAAPGPGYRLTVTHLDEASASSGSALGTLVANKQVLALVGPYDSQTALALMPVVAHSGLLTISPGATLPGLTLADAAQAEQVPFAQLHPTGKPLVFFRLPPTDSAAGTAAADLAVAPASAHGFAAGTVFVANDGSPSGMALDAAFRQELVAKHAAIVGQATIALVNADSAQAAVTAIIEAQPNLVFYAGGLPAGAALRGTLSLTGAPELPILSAGPIADHPGWAAAVGVTPAAANTAALLPAPDLSTRPNAHAFVVAYQRAYPGQTPLPQSALAYDAAMDQIAAIRLLIHQHQPVTRAAVRATVAAAKYAGVTGILAFDANGDDTAPGGFSLYACDPNGVWHYQASIMLPGQ